MRKSYSRVTVKDKIYKIPAPQIPQKKTTTHKYIYSTFKFQFTGEFIFTRPPVYGIPSDSIHSHSSMNILSK